jgi:hypothetical protein
MQASGYYDKIKFYVAGSRWLFWIIVAAFLWLMVGHLTEIERPLCR